MAISRVQSIGDSVSALTSVGVPQALADHFPELPSDAIAWMIYGSQARGDSIPGSDLDVLVVVEGARASISRSDVNVSFYTLEHLRTGVGTLFGAHLRRDGRILWDPENKLVSTLAAMGEVDTSRLFSRSRQMSCILTQPERDLPRYLPGLLREARYLLRSCLYAAAIAEGEPCFSVRELARRHNDPALTDLLASRQVREPERQALEDCKLRLENLIGPLPDNPFGSLESLVVNLWESPGDLLSMAFMALGSSGQGGDYAEVEKILL